MMTKTKVDYKKEVVEILERENQEFFPHLEGFLFKENHVKSDGVIAVAQGIQRAYWALDNATVIVESVDDLVPDTDETPGHYKYISSQEVLFAPQELREDEILCLGTIDKVETLKVIYFD